MACLTGRPGASQGYHGTGAPYAKASEKSLRKGPDIELRSHRRANQRIRNPLLILIRAPSAFLNEQAVNIATGVHPEKSARLLDRRKLLSISEPISVIAYACGFRDYTHFARRFRHRFGYSPGAHSDAKGRASNATVRLSTGESAR
jgi:hypothetical protein